jgi:hypothetical protein
VLTKPSKGVKNDGYDNEDSDYILYVNDILGSEEAGHKYLTPSSSLPWDHAPHADRTAGIVTSFSMFLARVLSDRLSSART